MWRNFLVGGGLTLLWLTSGVWAQVSVKAIDRPVYTNRPYGYVVTVPRDLTYTRTSPPNPDHGFGVDLQGGNKLWVDASYTDSSSKEDEAVIITTGCRVGEKRTAVLGGRAALSIRFTCPAGKDGSAYTELVTFAVHSQGDRSSADYQVGLRVYGSDISFEEKMLFGKIVDAFHFDN